MRRTRIKLLGWQSDATGIRTGKYIILHFGYVKLVVCLLNHNQFVFKSKCWLISMVSCEWKGQECG